ncbi:MAG: hypothetical protein P1V13_07365 [Rhizobiaceae bacterium]|nr:hypothetical protein [Rhizobiaceae bacterium]|tara:strand:+ start:55966 stop:56490 length:525 start_codon:yes stop_codon:yes gene_type:complete
MYFRIALSILALFTSLIATQAWAGAKEKVFFDSVSGVWRGPGKIVAGKYKGTKFVCNLKGGPSVEQASGVALDGHCRVGVFSQKMSAIINLKGGKYSGRFLDGAAGEGLDITSGKVRGNKITVGINRRKLDGAMVAHLEEPDTMNITVSVKVQNQMIPVIGMTLTRESKVGSKR